MLSETHKRITALVSLSAKLNEHNTALLERGSVYPDYEMNFPHHYAKDLVIARKILNARKMFLEDIDECYYELGVALHFVQDKWTLRPRIADKHTEWEQMIHRSEYVSSNENEFEKVLITVPNNVADLYRLYSTLTPFCFLFNVFDLKGIARDRYFGQLLISFKENLDVFLLAEKKFGIVRSEELNEYTSLELSSREFQKYSSIDDARRALDEKGKTRLAVPAEVQVISFAILGHPSIKWSSPSLDFSFATYVSGIISRYVLLSPDEDVKKYFARNGYEERWFDKQKLMDSLNYLNEIELDLRKEMSEFEQARRYSTTMRMLFGDIKFSTEEILGMLGVDRELSLQIYKGHPPKDI